VQSFEQFKADLAIIQQTHRFPNRPIVNRMLYEYAVVLCILHGFDLVTTWLAFRVGAIEANALIAPVLSAGWAYAIIVKACAIAVSLLACLTAYYYQRDYVQKEVNQMRWAIRITLTVIVIFSMVVVVHNLVVFWRGFTYLYGWF
jgi:Domain of unknown function (DUF5658)